MYISSGSNSNTGQSLSGMAMEILISGSGNGLLPAPTMSPTSYYEIEYNSDHLSDEITIFALIMIVIVICCCCIQGCQVTSK